MTIFRSILIFAIAAVLTACVSAPPIQQPIKFNSTDSYQLYRSPLLDQTGHTLQHLNQSKDILYYQTYGGGGAAVGVLFGPLGVLANIKAIESSTMKDVALLKDKIALEPNEIFLASAFNDGITIKSDASNKSLKLNPYLLIEKTEGEVIKLASVILIDHADSTNKLQSKYLVQLPVSYSVAELSALDSEKTKALQVLVRNGFSSLINRIKSEATASTEMEEKITVASDFLTPRFAFELAGSLIEEKDDYSWVRLVGGVYGVRNSDISIKKTTAKPGATAAKKTSNKQ